MILSAQSLINTAWAFAKNDHKSPALFKAISGEYSKLVPKNNEVFLGNLLWAFAKNGERADKLFEAVAGEHERLVVRGGDELALSTILWAVSAASERSWVHQAERSGGGGLPPSTTKVIPHFKNHFPRS